MKMRWKRNIGRIDQILRLCVGAMLIWAGFIDATLIGDRVIAASVGVFGVLNTIAALVRVCPFYTIAGINTDTLD